VSVRTWAEAALAGPGVALLLFACVSSLVLRVALDRVHLLAPASVGAVLVAAAAVVRGPLITLGVRGLLLAVLLGAGSPLVAVATARAVRVRDHGAWQRRPGGGGRRP
jgi:hypothetical protein